MAPHNRSRTLISAAIAAALLGAAGTTLAQDNLVLEEVTVTAQKRAQSLGDVPLAVSALTNEQLLQAGVTDMYGVARQQPVLEVQSNVSTTNTNLRMRRVGNLGNIPTFEPAVGVFIDGAFRNRALFGVTELYDVERIELLRGPQSTLYGKNVSAGVVGIYTARPTDEFDWKAEATYGQNDANGSAGLFNFKGGFGGPLGESLSASLGMAYADNDPIMTQALAGGAGEDSNDLGRFSARGQLLWDATDKLSLRFIAGYVHEDSNATTADIYYDPNGYLPIVLGTFQQFGISIPCSDNDPHNRIGCSRTSQTQDLDAWEFTIIGEYALDNGWGITSITSYDEFDNYTTQNDVAQVSAPVGKFQDTQKSWSWQQELRLASAGGETVDWLAGVFWYTNTFERGDKGNTPTFANDIYSNHPVVAGLNQQLLGTPFPLPFAVAGQNGYLDSQQETDYLGIYGQATWNISDRWSITGGLRWQEETKDAYIHQWTNVPGPSIFSLLVSPAAVSGDGLHRSGSEVTWQIQPQWFVTDDTMLFAIASHGWKSGGFNTGFGSIPISQREFQDEDIDDLEVGFKSTLMGGRLYLADTAFATDYDNYQDAGFIGAQFTVGNAEKTTLRGAELEGQFLISDSWSSDFALSYADLKYKTNTHGMCYPGRAPDSPTTPGACDLSGDHPVGAPLWRTHVGLQYDRDVSWGDLYVRADWTWSDDYNTSFSSDPNLVQDAYNWLNLRVGTRWDRYELVAWVDNLLDEDVAIFDSVLNLYTGDNSYQSFMQAPLSYGLTFRVNY